ncbi:NADPH-dependent F420 reductase [Nonomuraea longicatena]|uniref:NAD(P)-binding domain-containing protein n=1 Tax=Nonomuraea longicatena TaxID=83682 RepID=A0ABN1QFK6_9ACTN
MSVAIIGTGNIGSRLAADLAAGGVDVLVAGTNLDNARKLADTLDGHGTAVSVADAISQADVVVMAVWFETIKQLITEYGGRLDGKIVVDPSNPIAPDGEGGFAKTIGEHESAGGIISTLLPDGAGLVKAFGTLSAETLASASRRSPERAVGFYAADDQQAGKKVAELIRAAGFEPVRVGGIDQSIRIEVFGDLHEIGGLGHAVSKEEALSAL